MKLLHLYFVVSLAFCAATAEAHKLSDSYLKLRTDNSRLIGQWDINLVDFDNLMGLDTNQDGLITWGEVRAKRAQLEQYFAAHISVRSDGVASQLSVKELLITDHTDGPYATLLFDAGHSVGKLEVRYDALFNIDPTHRGLLSVITPTGAQSAVFSPEHQTQSFDLQSLSPWHSFAYFVAEGTGHISGFDHLLFLSILLLPCVLRWNQGRWESDGNFRAVIRRITAIVTAFTLAHSLTFAIASLGVVHLPSRWVEIAIAASIFIPAVNILHPFLPGKGWAIAMGFGLIHGFGFANVLADMDLKGGSLAPALLGFNLGVEMGQLAILGVTVPLFFALRDTILYRQILLKAGAACAGLLALGWMIERMFYLNFVPLH